MSFIVANLDSETRLKLALNICGEDCLQEVRVELAKKEALDINKLLVTNLQEAKNDHDEL